MVAFFEFVLTTGLIICIAVLLWTIFEFIKNKVTFKNRVLIIEAIREYHYYCLDHNLEPKVTYADMEEYEDTYKRYWDFGFTRILPEEKFEVIKWFIRT